MSQFPPPSDSLWGQPPSHNNAPRGTSRTGAKRIASAAPTLRAQVLAYIASRGDFGATDEEGEDATGLKPQTYTPRRWELVHAGSVRDSGKRRKTKSGSSAAVWVVVESGKVATT